MNFCNVCGGSGLVLERDTELRDIAVPCPACQGGRAARIEAALSQTGLPPALSAARYAGFNWGLYRGAAGEVDTGKQRKLIEHFRVNFRDWQARGMGLYIFSRIRGSGKTFLSVCLMNDLVELLQLDAFFIRAADLLDFVKSKDPTASEIRRRDPISFLNTRDLLIIDDLGQKISGAGWLSDILYQIVDYRLSHRAVTIFTSNVLPGELELDERIISRVDRCSISVGLPEVSVRAREANEQKKLFLSRQGLL